MNEAVSEKKSRSTAELVAAAEALIFVSEEPIAVKMLAEVLEEDRESVQAAVEELRTRIRIAGERTAAS